MNTPLSGSLDALLTQWGIHDPSQTRTLETALRDAMRKILTEEQIGQVRLSVRWDQVTIEAPASTYPMLAWQKDQLRAIAETESRGTIVTMRLLRKSYE